MLARDLHTHTLFSHGKGTPEQNVLSAIERNLDEIAISEHAPAHMFFGVRGEKLRRLRREVDSLASRYANDIRVLMGIECNLTGYGLCDLPEDCGAFDVKLLAFHKGARPADGFGRARAREALHIGAPDPAATAEALLLAAQRYRIDIFAHPGLYVKCDIPALARGARELGIPLEINAARVTMTAAELSAAADEGASFIIGSDAHEPARVGDDALALAAAREAGVEERVVNLRRNA